MNKFQDRRRQSFRTFLLIGGMLFCSGMWYGSELEKLTIEHLKVPGVRVAPNYPTRYATNYYRGIICDEYDMNWEAK